MVYITQTISGYESRSITSGFQGQERKGHCCFFLGGFDMWRMLAAAAWAWESSRSEPPSHWLPDNFLSYIHHIFNIHLQALAKQIVCIMHCYPYECHGPIILAHTNFVWIWIKPRLAIIVAKLLQPRCNHRLGPLSQKCREMSSLAKIPMFRSETKDDIYCLFWIGMYKSKDFVIIIMKYKTHITTVESR